MRGVRGSEGELEGMRGVRGSEGELEGVRVC